MDLNDSLFYDRLPAKLTKPRLGKIYPRKRVYDALLEGMDSACFWISGPAGSGKSTAINSFISKHNLPCIWYTIDEGDTDIVSFFDFLRKASIAWLLPDSDPPPALSSDYFPSIQLFAIKFFEQLFSKLRTPMVIVFDDFHVISDHSSLHGIIRNIIGCIPRGINLFIVSRQEPPPKLTRFQLNKLLYRIGWDDLKLELSETIGITKLIAGPSLSHSIVSELHIKVDGWIAGLILVLKKGVYNKIKAKNLSIFTPQEIFDFLNGELFDKLPEKVRTRMMQLAFLTTISESSAKEITGNPDAGVFLRQLHRENAFLTKTVGESIVYRFHTLMRDFLQFRAQESMSPESLLELKQRSAAILENESNFEEATKLYISGMAVQKAVRLILTNATHLADQGRFGTLDRLVASVPESVCEKNAWLIYWQAISKLPYSVRSGGDNEAYRLLTEQFERALVNFQKAEDPIGCYLALAGILESIWMEMDDFRRVDPWIKKFDEMCVRWDPNKTPEAMQWIIPSVISAMVMRQPDHPKLTGLLQKGMDILKAAPGTSTSLRIFLPVAFLSLLRGDLSTVENLITIFHHHLNKNISPWATLIYYTVYSFYLWLVGRFKECTDIAHLADQLEEMSGLQMIYPYMNGAIGAIYIGDMDMAESLIQKAQPHLANHGQYSMSFYHAQAGWVALAKKDLVSAKMHGSEGLLASEEAGCPLTLPINQLLFAIICHLTGESERAQSYLNQATDLAQKTLSTYVEFSCRLFQAELSLVRGSKREFHESLSQAFTLGRKNNYVSAHFWRPDIIAELCRTALELGIEVQYVRQLIMQHCLRPAKIPMDADTWPWEIRIRTLGQFSVEIDGSPIFFKGKVQHRPLSLLKYIIAKGGSDVSVTLLQDHLWPDSDGDRANIAFKTALHRLRSLIGKKMAIVQNAGYLMLDQDKIWTDTCAFDALEEKIEASFKEPESSISSQFFLDSLLSLYRGPFLPDDDLVTIIQVRHHMESRFSRLVKRLVIDLLMRGHTDPAVIYLNKAVTAAPSNGTLERLLAEYQ